MHEKSHEAVVLGNTRDLEGVGEANTISSEFLLNNKMPCKVALQKG